MTNRRRTPLLITILTLVAALLTACSGNPASFSGGGGGGGGEGGEADKNLTIAVVAGWDEDIAASYLWKELLEQRGYTVTLQELDVASTFTGVANGQIDLYMDAWLPATHQVYWDRYQSKLEVLSTWSEGKNMIVVPSYVNIDSLDQLKAHSDEFGGQIVGIEAGAGLMKATREQIIPQYGLDNYSLVEGSSPAMLAALDTSIKQKKPIVVTLWQPHWAFSAYDLKVLEDPKDAFGKPDQMQVIATKGFSEQNPEAAGYLGKFKIETADLASLLLEMRTAGKGNEQAAAKKWISEHQEVVDAWVGSSPASG